MMCENTCVQLCEALLETIIYGIQGVGYGIALFCIWAGVIGGMGLPSVLLYKFLRGRDTGKGKE